MLIVCVSNEFRSLLWKQWSMTRLSAGIYAFPNSHQHLAVIHVLGCCFTIPAAESTTSPLPLDRAFLLTEPLTWVSGGADASAMLLIQTWTGDQKCPAAAGLRRNKGLKAFWWVCFQEGRCHTVAWQVLPWTECAVLEGMELIALVMLKFHLPYFFSDGAKKIYHLSSLSAREEVLHLMLILS